MSRRPPPNVGPVRRAPAWRLRCRCRRRRQEDGGAGGRSPDRGVRVQADEEIRLVVVRERRTIVERDVPVVVSRQQDADAETSLDDALDAARDGERQILFLRPLRAAHAVVFAAVAGIDRDRSDRRGGRRQRGRHVRRRLRRGRDRRRWRCVVSVSLGTKSMTSRAVASAGCTALGIRRTADRDRSRWWCCRRRGRRARTERRPARFAAAAAASGRRGRRRRT